LAYVKITIIKHDPMISKAVKKRALNLPKLFTIPIIDKPFPLFGIDFF